MERRHFLRAASLVPLFLILSCQTRQAATVVSAPAPTVDHARSLSQQSVDAVLWQHTSAEARRLYQQGYELARLRLDANLSIASADPRPPAVIVDVDETVLDNSLYEMEAIAGGTTFRPDRWKAWTAREVALALPGSVEFLHYAATKGCVVFYITNRDADEKQWTVANLMKAGFPFSDEAHVMARDATSDKTARRAAVSASHRVVLLVGDQLTDFDERLKDRSRDHGRTTTDAMADTLARYFVLLPNPMYGTWRDAITGSGKDATDSTKFERVRTFFSGYKAP